MKLVDIYDTRKGVLALSAEGVAYRLSDDGSWQELTASKTACHHCKGEYIGEPRKRQNGPHIEEVCPLCGKHLRFAKKGVKCGK